MALFVTTLAFAQNINVTGIVTDSSNGEGIPFASVQLKGTMTGVSTDAEGHYSISVSGNGTLVFSSVGYTTREVEINHKATLNVVLDPDAEFLDETIVVAFGTTTKEAFTGSAKVIGDETLALSQVSNVTSALAGQVAGVQLVSSNGAPGSSPTIRIRGISSINAGKDPLIIVDGAPYDGDMNNISPADIESMTVLKDAASNALYGARGANGVIMITTKRAKKGQAVVSFDAKVGVNTKAIQHYQTINDPRGHYEQQYLALYNYYTNADGLGLSPAEAYINANKNINSANSGGTGYQIFTVPQGQMLIGNDGKLNPQATLGYLSGDHVIYPDNWEDYAFRKGIRNEYNVTISGAEDKISYYSSISYLRNQGVTENSDMQRFTARLKGDYQAKDWLKVGVNMAYSKFDGNSLSNNGSDSSTANVWAYTSQIAPVYPLWVRDANGQIYKDKNGIEVMDHGNGTLSLGGIPGTSRPFITDANPLLANKLNTNYHEGNALSAQGFIDINILKDLKLTINASANLDETRTTYVYNPYYGQFRTTEGTIELYHTREFEWNAQQLLNYTKGFGQHNISLLLGHEYYNDAEYLIGAGKSHMFSQDIKELDSAVLDTQNATSYRDIYNNEGYFFRAQYDFAERYFFSLSARRDASSRFHPDNRWGNFWSIGGAWIINKESWFQAPWLNELKFKASIGSQGNDQIGSYRYTDVFNIVPSDGAVSTIFDSKGNKDITWETNTNINAGFEFAMLNGAINGGLEYFNRRTTDMLFPTPVAPSQGYTSIYKNVGDMNNQGVELDITFNIFNKKNFQWSVNVNGTYLQNKIVKLADSVKDTKAYDADGNVYEGYTSGSFFVAEGLPMYTWYNYDYAGVDAQSGKSTWYKHTKDADGNVTGRETTDAYSQADRYVTKRSTLAPVYGGFGTSLYYHGFDFALNFTYQLGGTQYDGTYAQLMYCPNSGQNGYAYHKDILNAWTPSNTNTDVPRFAYGDVNANSRSTRFETSARYLNLQNVNFGYTLPSRLTQKILVSSMRFYVAAENLCYWSARKGFDPRQSYSSSASAANYSPMRTVSGGITVKF